MRSLIQKCLPDAGPRIIFNLMRFVFWIPLLSLLLSCASSNRARLYIYTPPKGLFDVTPASPPFETRGDPFATASPPFETRGDPFATAAPAETLPEVQDVLTFFVELGLEAHQGDRIQYHRHAKQIRVHGSPQFNERFRKIYRQILIPPTCN